MRHRFIRCLFGRFLENNQKYVNRISTEIELTVLNPFERDYAVYVYGEDNVKFLKKFGVTDIKLINPDSEAESVRPDHVSYLHKIYVLRAALHDYDAVTLLDWDCQRVNEIPEDYPEVVAAKSHFLAPLRKYSRPNKAYWRGNREGRYIPEACYVYLNSIAAADEMINLNKALGTNNEEMLFAKYTDNLTGGWKGYEEYNKRFGVPYSVGGKGRVRCPGEIKKLFQHFVSAKAAWLRHQLQRSENPTKIIRKHWG